MRKAWTTAKIDGRWIAVECGVQALPGGEDLAIVMCAHEIVRVSFTSARVVEVEGENMMMVREIAGSGLYATRDDAERAIALRAEIARGVE